MPPTKTKNYMQSVNDYLVVKKEFVEEKRSAGGIILNVSSAFDFKDEFSKRNICYAEVMYANQNIPFLKSGDRIAMNPNKGAKASLNYEDYTVITKDQFLSKIDKDGKFIIPPESILVKIKKDDRDSLFSKWILKDDGTKVQLFIEPEPDKYTTNASKKFVSLGEVIQVGDNIKNVELGDIAILDYTVDNFIDNVLYYDDEGDKYVVIDGETTFHTGDTWAYAKRDRPRDTLVSKRGDMDIVSPLLGLIRGEELIARFPYVFVNHEHSKKEMVSPLGIIYSEQRQTMQRTILAVSEESEKKYNLKKGKQIIISDFDIFSVQLRDKKIDCVVDLDILMYEK